MNNVMHKFFIYLSIYFCLTCFGLSFSPSSEPGVQFRQWFSSPGYGASALALTPYLGDFADVAEIQEAVTDELKNVQKE
jgi:hypothetical protein